MTDKKSKEFKPNRAGLQFPIARIQKMMKENILAERVGPGAAVYMAAVLEYLTAEVLELSGNVAREHKKVRIGPRHIMFAVRNDEELSRMLRHVTIAQGGVQPHIARELVRKKKGHAAAEEEDDESMI